MPATFSFAFVSSAESPHPNRYWKRDCLVDEGFHKTHVLKTGYSQSCTPDDGTTWGMLLPTLQLTLSFPENTS